MYSFDRGRDNGDHFEHLAKEFATYKKNQNQRQRTYAAESYESMGCGCNKSANPFESYLSPVSTPEIRGNLGEKTVDYRVPSQTSPDMQYYTGKELEGIDEIQEMDADMALLWALAGEISQKLYPMIMETLNEYEYEGSPIFGDAMDREFIAQIVDRILEKAVKSLEEVEEISYDSQGGSNWHRHRLLRASIEAGVIVELGACRRPRYRRVMRHCDKVF